MVRSEPALVATWTPVSGLHSSSSTTSSYWYFDFPPALRSFTARSAEFRPPRPIAELPPVSGPTNARRTVSFACAPVETANAAATAARSFRMEVLLSVWWRNLAHGRRCNSTRRSVLASGRTSVASRVASALWGFLGANRGAVGDVGAEVQGDVLAAVQSFEDLDGGAVVAAQLDLLELHVCVLHRSDEHLAALRHQRVGRDERTGRAAHRDRRLHERA